MPNKIRLSDAKKVIVAMGHRCTTATWLYTSMPCQACGQTRTLTHFRQLTTNAPTGVIGCPHCDAVDEIVTQYPLIDAHARR